MWSREQEDAAGIARERVLSPPPRLSVATEDLPDTFSWADKDGKSYVTKSLNQHINITELIKRTTDGSLFRQRPES